MQFAVQAQEAATIHREYTESLERSAHTIPTIDRCKANREAALAATVALTTLETPCARSGFPDVPSSVAVSASIVEGQSRV